jgi:hypothetical protein
MDVDEPPELPDLEAGNASAESPRVEAPPSSDARATVVAPVKGTRPPKAQSTAPPQTQSPAELPTESQPEPDPEPQPQPQPQPLQPQYSTTIAYGPDNVVQVCEVCYSIGDTWGRNAMYCLGREDLARCAVANAIKLEEQAKAKAKAESKVERKRKRSSVASTRKSASAGTGTMRRGRKSKVKVEEEAGPEQVGGPEAVLDTADTVDPHESPRTPGDPAAASSTVPDAQRLEADDRSPSSSDLEHDPEWIPPVPSASPERAPPPAGEYAATPTRAPTEPTQRRRSGLANFMFRARASLPADGGAGASPLDKLRAENRRHSRAASERPGSESSSRASELRHSISSVRHTPPMRPTRTSPEKAKDGVPDSSPVVVRRKPARPLASSSSPTTSSVTRPDSSTSPRASSSPVNLSGASARTGRKRVLPAQPAAPTPADGQGQDSGVHFRILPFSPALLQRLGADAQQPSPPPPQGSSPSPPHKRVRISDRTDEPRRRPGPA